MAYLGEAGPGTSSCRADPFELTQLAEPLDGAHAEALADRARTGAGSDIVQIAKEAGQ
jgi:hypothetical protein